MMALSWLYYVLCLVLYSCAVPQTQRQRLNSRSFIPRITPSATISDTTWLVSMSGNCQGIVLSKWWILSTANCLQKTKLYYLNILGISDQESFLHGQRICLHPRFNPQGGKDSIKGDIGLLFLENLIRRNDVSLSQVPNVSLKSCSKCQYRSCQVYQHQNSIEFGVARVKKISVQLLDLSVCHHQHSYLEKTEGLCIRSQPQQDCWVQQASPVLCLLKNHWELVGLTHKTSKICHKPTVIIRTAPYLTWMKQIIKASKKLLNPTPPLQCRILHESEHVPQIRHGHNYPPTMASHKSFVEPLEKNLGTKHPPNSPATFNLNGANSFSGNYKYFPEKSHIPQAGRFLVEQLRTSSVARLPEKTRTISAQYHKNTGLLDKGDSLDSLVASTAKAPFPGLISDTTILHNPSMADTAKPWGQPIASTDESWDQIIANIVKQWSPSEDNQAEAQSPDTTDGSWKDINTSTVEQLNDLRAYTSRPWDQLTTTTGRIPLSVPPYDKGPWTSFIPGENTETTTGSQNILVTNSAEPLDPYLTDNTWVPLPTDTIEPWSSTSEYYVARSQDQFVTDSVRSQNYPTVDMDRLQILSTANLHGSSTPSKMVIKPTVFENKITPYQALSQGQSSLKAKKQSAAGIEP